MRSKVLTGMALLAAVLGGCNSIERRQTTVNTPVMAANMAMYTQGSCWGWEPPRVTTSSPPSHGRVTHALMKGRIKQPGSKCDGQPVDAWVSTYVPNPGFRGEDRFSLSYSGIWNDAGRQLSESKEIVVEVK